MYICIIKLINLNMDLYECTTNVIIYITDTLLRHNIYIASLYPAAFTELHN